MKDKTFDILAGDERLKAAADAAKLPPEVILKRICKNVGERIRKSS